MEEVYSGRNWLSSEIEDALFFQPPSGGWLKKEKRFLVG